MIINKQELKKCKICKKEKLFSEFYPVKSGKYGIDSKCKECNIEENKKFNRTKKGLIYEIYRTKKKQITITEDTFNFSRDEFYKWVTNEELFLDLYNSWVNNNYNQDLKPACYKTDSDSGYKLDNLGIATSKQVTDKNNEDIKTGKNHTFNSKTSKRVIQYTKDGKFIKKHHSIHAAERYLQEINNNNKIYNVGITNCTNGKLKTSHGYKWVEDTSPIEKTKFGEKIDVKHLNNYLLEDIENILGNEIIIDTEKENLIKCRIGQGKFRDQLIEYWKGCSVTNFQEIDLLIASHIKPWRSSSNMERLDVYNGFLLTPNLDKLFDKGYISFDDDGKILISNELKEYYIFGISIDMQINLDENHKQYLQFHRESIYKRKSHDIR